MKGIERLCFSPKFSDKAKIGIIKRQGLIAYRDEFPKKNPGRSFNKKSRDIIFITGIPSANL